jgi:hypothetical protein
VLTYEQTGNNLVAVVMFLAVVTCIHLMGSWGFVATVFVFTLLCIAVLPLNRVTVVSNRSVRYCKYCQYDLKGTIEAGIDRCPECGDSFEQDATK